MRQQPTTTLTELAAERIDSAFPESYSGPVRVVWWDDGGYLKKVVAEAADEAGVEFRAAERYPLELREGAVEEEHRGETPQVWYIGEGKHEREWFRDIEATGGEETSSIESLTADLYDVDPWDIFDAERHDAEQREQAAGIILNRFSGLGTPRLDDIREEILTKGEGQLLDHLLRQGWPEIERDEETTSSVIDQLQKIDIPVDEDDSPETITTTVRKWAVARWLVATAVDVDRFPSEMNLSDAGPGELNPLKGLLRTRGSPEAAETYLGESYWPDVIKALDDPWEFATCPVDSALDVALWEEWVEWYEDGSLERCIESAERRQEAVQLYSDECAWVGLWEQARLLAQLEQYFREWETGSEDEGPFEAYADAEEGSWRIDDMVLQLDLTGTPETGLPRSHPAREWLSSRRQQLTIDRYREYLEALGDQVRSTMQVGEPLAELKPAYQWWSEKADEFEEAGNVAVLLIDALRFDLAQQLADLLESDHEVRRETRLSVLPSETKFGMAALTPGDAFRFRLYMDDNTLSVQRGGQSLGSKPNRVQALDERGWEVPEDAEWGKSKIAYYDKELDDVGEGEVGDIEAHFRGYIDDLYDLIERKLENHNWDRIYVVTDHGFVLFPQEPTMEALDQVEGAVEVKYRRVAGDSIDGSGKGILVEANTPGANYLDTNVRLLSSPRQHFSKQGYGSRRYYHGGLLPQECILSFLRVE